MLLHRPSYRKRATRDVLRLSIWTLLLVGPIPIALAQTTDAPSQQTSPSPQQTSPAPAGSTAPPSPEPVKQEPARAPSPPPAAAQNAGSTAEKPLAPAATKPSPEGIPATVIDSTQAQGILGTQVRSSAGEDMGRIVDVIVDKQAQARGVVIDFGGFLGVGSRQIAIAWSAIRFSPQDKQQVLVIDFTQEQLRAAPAYKSGEQIVLLGPSPKAAHAATTTAPPAAAPPAATAVAPTVPAPAASQPAAAPPEKPAAAPAAPSAAAPPADNAPGKTPPAQ